MSDSIDLQRLRDYFEPDDIEWKPITLTKDGSKALAAAYVTNRAIMDRLDEVCGPGNWRNEYASGPDGGVLCGISVRVDGEWVTKWDGAENTDIHPVKGGLSTSMRRAAVQWGIGRYLYQLTPQWVPADERGRFTQQPAMPAAFLPAKASSSQPPPAPVPTTATAGNDAAPPHAPAPRRRSPAQPRNGASEASNGSEPERRSSTDVDEYRMPKSYK